MTTAQMRVWTGAFGREYTERNRFDSHEAFNRAYVDRFGLSRDELNLRMLDGLDRDICIVEVGANVGYQLRALRHLGFRNLHGVEIQEDAVRQARHVDAESDVIVGSALAIPFPDGFADLVFTNNVLIHFAPDDLGTVMDEMHRVATRYIWGFEYFSPEITEVSYRGHDALLWKADYARLFRERFADLQPVAEECFDYKDGSGLVDKMYLLRKRGE